MEKQYFLPVHIKRSLDAGNYDDVLIAVVAESAVIAIKILVDGGVLDEETVRRGADFGIMSVVVLSDRADACLNISFTDDGRIFQAQLLLRILANVVEHIGFAAAEGESPRWGEVGFLMYTAGAMEHRLVSSSSATTAANSLLAGVRRGGESRAQQIKARADRWRLPALELAKSIRAKKPSHGDKAVASAIVERVPDAPDIDTVVRQLSAWGREGKLNRSTSHPAIRAGHKS